MKTFFIIERATGRKFRNYVKSRGIYVDTWIGKGATTRVMNKNNLHETHDAVPVDEYQPVMVERINLQSGKPFMEDINTPAHCSPASERYWTM
jgi:hypothetical protein